MPGAIRLYSGYLGSSLEIGRLFGSLVESISFEVSPEKVGNDC